MPQDPRTRLFIGVLLFITVLLGYNYFARPFAQLGEKTVESTPTPRPTPQISVVEQAYEQLTPEQKINQMLAIPLTISTTNDSVESVTESLETRGASDAAESTSSAAPFAEANMQNETVSISTDWVEQQNPGFLLIFGKEIRKSQAREAVSIYKSLPLPQENKLLPAIAVDHEGGVVQRLSGVGYTKLPSWRELCNQTESDRLEFLIETSSELQETGVDIVFAPVLDLASNNPVLQSRTCANEPEKVASAAAEFSRAFLNKGITPVFKHFPGIGSVFQDLHFSFSRVNVSDEASTLYRDMLSEFGEAGVMVTHVGVTNSTSPDTPCSLSGECVGALRRYFPELLVFTDSLTMEAVYGAVATSSAHPTLTEVSRQAILAGNDVLVYDETVTEAAMSELVTELALQYEQDPQFANAVNDSVKRIIRYKEQQNLLRTN